MCPDQRHWPQTQRVWRQFDQLDLVMQRTGVVPVVAARKDGGKAMAQARNRCLACLHQVQCRSFLDHDNTAAIMEFCPNAEFLNESR